MQRRPSAKPERREEVAPTSVLSGVLPVTEALRNERRNIERVIIADGARDARLQEIYRQACARGVPVMRQPRAELDRLTDGRQHQGVVALVAPAAYADAEALLENIATVNPSLETKADEAAIVSSPLLLVLDGVEDPRNFGAILRTAECAGAQGVFIPERRAVGLTETVAKTSAGALEYVPVARVVNIVRLLEDLQARGIWTIGADAEAKQDYTAWDWRQPSALIVGGEGAGLHRLTRERCDTLVKIPLHGRISSLNVSVAVAVMLFEAQRQRSTK